LPSEEDLELNSGLLGFHRESKNKKNSFVSDE